MKANILALIEREQKGFEKYGTTVDRDDLSLCDWLKHALEETLDKANYLRAAINKIQSGENTLNTRRTNPPTSNAVEVPDVLPQMTADLLAALTKKQLKETIFTLAKNPNVQFAYFANLVASAEAGKYLNPKEQMPSDVMLRMVGSFDKDQQRDLLKTGLEIATGKPIRFVDATPKATK